MKTLLPSPGNETAAKEDSVSDSSTPNASERRRTVSFGSGKIDWHKDISYAVKAGRFETIRGHLSLQLSVAANKAAPSESARNESGDGSKSGSKGGFWSRLSGLNFIDSSKDSTGLLTLDEDGRTPLHVALTSRRTPTDVILSMIRVEPKAVAVANGRGRFPLHFAVVHRQHIKVIAELIDTFPAALSAQDTKGMSPLSYALDGARRETNLSAAPSSFWQFVPDESDEARWQEEQGERWGIVHWLLLSSATYPQTSLSVGGKKPMLVDALIYAAPPAVISLLIGASVVLLSHANRATAFAGSTLYSCIARHYPLTILMSLVSQCPRDVHKVRDETGMGLVSSQFISGCFKQNRNTHEWSLSGDFYAKLLEAIEDEFLKDDDPAFLDWWKKIEFLIAFCSGANNPDKFPKAQLLHAALKNIDTPPMVVRMLLALHPQSIQLLDQETLAHPLFIAASRPEYVPRNYEVAMCGRESILEIVLSQEKRLMSKRHELRLPLHAAIDSGRVFSEYKCLVTSRPEFLLQRDPITGLFPFLQAAVARQKQGHFRLTCVARNKYSYAEWTNMSGSDKESAIQQVTDQEELALFESIYQLLRLEPLVVEHLNVVRKHPVSEDRNSHGMGMVSTHFISWLYEEKERGVWVRNEANAHIFLSVLDDVSGNGELPTSFNSWWNTMKYLIRQCCPNKLSGDERKLLIPDDDDRYLLHAALLNSDTPPQIVSLLLTLNPQSLSLCLPGTSLLPLHIAAWTAEYTSRSFETFDRHSLEIVSLAYPAAARQKSDGFLPLHIAIRSGKIWRSFRSLVDIYTESILEKDPATQLYPFQLVAMDSNISSDLRLSFQYAARKKYDELAWKKLTPFQQSKDVRLVQLKHNQLVLDAVFEMLRKSASILADLTDIGGSEKEDIIPENDVEARTPVFARPATRLVALDNTEDKKGGYDTSENDTFADGTDFSFDGDGSMTTATQSVDDTSSILQRRTQSLMRHLSRNESHQENKDVFECDTSVLSNVDVLSVMSSSLHTGPGENAQRNASQRRLMGLDSAKSNTKCQGGSESDFGGSEQSDGSYPASEPSSTAEFAEESSADTNRFSRMTDAVGSQKETSSDDRKFLEHRAPENERNAEKEFNEKTQNEDQVVIFMIRRQPRFKTRNDRDFKPSVKLSKKTNKSELRFSAHGKPTIGADAQKSLQSSSHSVSSYSSIDPEAKKRLKAKKEQLWVSTQFSRNNQQESMQESISESSGVTFQEPTEGSFDEDKSEREHNLLGTLHDSDDESGLAFDSPERKGKRVVKGILSRTPSEDKRPKLPGIAAYLSSSKSRQTMHKEEESVNSNTPSTLSFLADGSHFAEASTDRSSMMATDIDNTSFSNSGENSINELSQSDLSRGHPDGSFSNSARTMDASATVSIPEGNEDDTSEHEKILLSSSKSSTETATDYVSISWTRNVATVPATVKTSDKPKQVKSRDGMPDTIHSNVEAQPSERSNKSDTRADNGSQTTQAANTNPVFDKKTMRWVKQEETQTQKSVCHVPDTQSTKTQTIPFASTQVKESAAEENGMYFDKKAMRWRLRSDFKKETDKSTADNASRQNRVSKQVRTTRSIPSPRIGMPFVDVVSRDEIKRRNARFMMRGVQKTKTPSDREFRSQWRHMFDVAEKKLCCLLCDTNGREVLMVPCRHLAICRKCSSKNKHISSCPLCHKPSTDRMLIF